MYSTAPASSPHIHAVPVQYQGTQSRRTTSFDGEMLPPPAVDDNSSAMFTTGGTLFSQPSWAAAPDMYTQPPSSLQQHLAAQQIASPPRAGGLGREQHIAGAHGAPYYPATTPGPPIQTTQNNKGPDGANLFIFHIPNHFTNLDMWHLFCHYGNLLSVRIMVEKETGRSRGFGFVSYDSPDAAAMAIKELNGFVIGNKRLKVQHKQIRQSDNNPGQQHEPASGHRANVGGTNTNVGWNGDETAERRPLSSTNAESQPPSMPDVSEKNEHVGSTLTNLDSIRDALPDVQ
jgi:CUG-BP- and ETR3-like factor